MDWGRSRMELNREQQRCGGQPVIERRQSEAELADVAIRVGIHIQLV